MYASQVKKQKLTFVVSGMLWQRSLIMRDEETGSLWSHLLGRAMKGKHKDTVLEPLPAVITDWKTWRTSHPGTTVLNMRRTARQFKRNFYRRGRHTPEDFVVGMVESGQAKAWPLPELEKHPVLNDSMKKRPLLIHFDPRSATAFVYDRRLKGKTLTFVLRDGKLTDKETKSAWDATRGLALSGELKGQRLKPLIGILSFRRAWRNFHPRSKYYKGSD